MADPKFLLMRYCLSVTPEEYLAQQRRDPKKALEMLETLAAMPSDKDLDDILARDLLCSVAWFKYGELHLSQQRDRDAMLSFLWSAIGEEHPYVAWANAFLVAMRLKDSVTALLILQTGYGEAGQSFVNELLELCNRNAIPTTKEETKKMILDIVGEFDERVREKGTTLRVSRHDIMGMRIVRD